MYAVFLCVAYNIMMTRNYITVNYSTKIYYTVQMKHIQMMLLGNRRGEIDIRKRE